MTTVVPYLTFEGNCEEAFNFYKSIFGGNFQYIGRYKELPETDRMNFPDEADEKIMHISLPISDETILMGCDSSPVIKQKHSFNENISLYVNTDSKEEANRIFNALSVGGQMKMPINETFWGAYFGALTDKYGIHWMISCELKEK